MKLNASQTCSCVDGIRMKFPRPRFSLKVLMLFVAVVGIFCAYHVNWIRQRHEFLKKNHNLNCHFVRWNGKDYGLYEGALPGISPVYEGTISRRTPKLAFNLLWMFGEARYEQVGLLYYCDHEDRLVFGTGNGENRIPRDLFDDAEKLFPEANVGYVVYDKDP